MSSLNPLIPIGKQVGEMLWSHERIACQTAKEQEKRTLELLRMVRIPRSG